MKKNVIAIVMSFALAVGSISWTPVMAAETPAAEAAEAQEVLPEEAASQDVELPDEASSREEAQAEEETPVQEVEPVSEVNGSADEQDESAPAGMTEEVAADEEETPEDPAGAEDVPVEEEKDEEAEEAASEGEEPADADAIKEEISEEANDLKKGAFYILKFIFVFIGCVVLLFVFIMLYKTIKGNDDKKVLYNLMKALLNAIYGCTAQDIIKADPCLIYKNASVDFIYIPADACYLPIASADSECLVILIEAGDIE